MKENNTKYYCDRCGADITGQMHRPRDCSLWYLRKVFDSESSLDTYVMDELSEEINRKVSEANGKHILHISFETRYSKKIKNYDLCKDCTNEFRRFMNEIQEETSNN